MKGILLLCLTAVSVFASSELWAQTRTVTGRITSTEDGSGLPGVNVVLKGTSNGTAADVEGKYTISVPPEGGTLVFTFIGLKSQEVAIGERAVVDVAMAQDMQQLSEVVVTALGVQRKEAALGYSATTVSSQDVSQGRSFSPINGLQGKVAGVIINTGSGAPGAQTFVNIRGLNSIGGNNNPLYVVDGVPVNNSFTNVTSDPANDVTRQQDFGNRANDFNPEDIESITILKSASSTAMYGSRAANGVILITTKKGKRGDGVKVDFTSSAEMQNPLRLPKVQQEFGQGWNAVNDYTQNGSWGPAFDGRNRIWGNVVDNSQQIKPYVPLPSNIKDFYETGTSYVNTLAVSGGSEKTSYYFSYGNTTQDGIVPTNADSYKRNNFSFRGTYTGKKLTITSSINYILKNSKAVTVGQGSNGATLFQEMIQIPNDISLVDVKDYRNKFNNLDNFYTPYNQNPYWVLNQNGNNYIENRIQGNVTATYNFNNWLGATWRVGSDVANGQIKDWIAIANFSPTGPNASEINVPGTVFRRGRYAREVNSDFMITVNKDLSHSLHLNGLIGNNVNQRQQDDYDASVSKLSVPDFYNLQNSSNQPSITTFQSIRRIVGLYANAELGYKDYLYLTLTARNDWSSTLPAGKNSYFYPGAAMSLVFSELLPSLQNKLSFGKLRVSVGQTGRDSDPYNIKNVFAPSNIALPFGNLKFPLNGVNAFEVSNQIGNSNLKPEITTEYEIGTELKFFQNRIGVDLSLYNKTTANQILASQLAASTGYGTQVRNFGKVQNKGIELLVTVVPIKTENFSWTLSSNWTINRNKVLELTDGLSQYLITSIYDIDFVAAKGQPIGVFRAPKDSTDGAGHVIVNGQGIPVPSSTKEAIGNIQSNFVTGLTNQFHYKGFNFSFTFDYRDGGKMYSYTKNLMEFVGNSTNTLYNDRQPFVVPNSVKVTGEADGKPTFAENDIPVNMNNIANYFTSNTNQVLERGHVLDRTFLKLREVVIGYSFPASMLQKTFLHSLNLSVYGRNLWLKTPASNNIIDPEVTAYPGSGVSAYAGEFAVSPSVRSYGVSLRAGL